MSRRGILILAIGRQSLIVMQTYNDVLFQGRILVCRNASTKHEKKKSRNGFLIPKDNPAPCHALVVICLVLTMTARQPGLKKFTPTVQSCSSCRRCSSSFQYPLYVVPHPCTEKERETRWKWRKYPWEEHPNRDKREPLLAPSWE